MSESIVIFVLVGILGGLLISLSVVYIYQKFYRGRTQKNTDPEKTVVQVDNQKQPQSEVDYPVVRNNRKPVDYSAMEQTPRTSFVIPPPPTEYPKTSLDLRKSLDTSKSTASASFDYRSSMHLMAHHGESDQVSSTLLCQAYTNFINAASLPLRSKITFKINFSDKDVKKVFEQGKMVKNCFNCLSVGLKDRKSLYSYISSRDRTLTPEQFLNGLENFHQDWQNVFDFTFRKLKTHWKLGKESDRKLEIFIDRGIEFLKMYEASDAQMIKTKMAEYDSRVHEFVGERGDGKIISLIPGLEREVGETWKVVYKERLGHLD